MMYIVSESDKSKMAAIKRMRYRKIISASKQRKSNLTAMLVFSASSNTKGLECLCSNASKALNLLRSAVG